MPDAISILLNANPAESMLTGWPAVALMTNVDPVDVNPAPVVRRMSPPGDACWLLTVILRFDTSKVQPATAKEMAPLALVLPVITRSDNKVKNPAAVRVLLPIRMLATD